MEELDKPLTPKEKKLNRQINFFVMRYMWQVIRGRGNGRIYDALYTSRERYTRIINTGTVRFKGGELDKWHEITGISKDIFTGNAVFRCVFENENGKKSEITKEEWEALFAWRDNRNGGNKRQKDDTGKIIFTIQDKIYKTLERVPRNDRNNRDFYVLCYYLINMAPAPLQTSDDVVSRIMLYLNVLTFEYLDTCSYKKLEAVYKLLKEKYSLTAKIYQYKEALNNQKKK